MASPRFSGQNVSAGKTSNIRAILINLLYNVQLLDECQICPGNLIGIGIGAPGLVNYKTGVIGFGRNQGWRNVQVGSFFFKPFEFSRGG